MKLASSYRWGVTLGGLVILIASVFCCPLSTDYWVVGLATILFAALQVNFPLRILGSQTTLIHILGLGVGILYGFPISFLAVTLGITGGTILSWQRNGISTKQLFRNKELWLEIGYVVGSNLLPLGWVWGLKEWAGGMSGNLFSNPQALGKTSLVLLGFAVIHSGLFIVAYYFQKPSKNKVFHRKLAYLGFVNLLPLPFIMTAVQAYPLLNMGSFLVLGGLLTVAEVLVHELEAVRSQSKRQLEELSTLNQISQALQSTLALDELLPIIHHQVTSFLGNDNFYVALYDEDRNTLWYPLAVKHNQRENWPRRPMEDRLTDRVILEKKAILLTPKYQQGSDYIGLPPSAETPHSWMGVPLLASERALGCLAVMGFDPNVEFTTSDLNLLKTLSGQVSVAIENALLYERTDQALTRRVQQLGMLERVGRQLSAELDLDRLFDLILQSALNITNTKVGGVGLYNDKTKVIDIKVSQGYHHALSARSAPIGIVGRVARTKQPQNVPDVRLDEDYYELYDGTTRSQLSVPMLHKERLLGVISVESPQLGAFSENDQVFVSQLANQAAVAVVNAELFSKATRERDRLDTLLDSVGEAILMIQNNGHVLLTNRLIQDFTGSQLSEIFGVHFAELPVAVQTVLGKNEETATPIEDILAGKYTSWPINDTYPIDFPNSRRIINRDIFPMGEEESRKGIVIVLRDITEEIHIRQERELINETLVHDLRSPASAVLGALDIIEDIFPESEEGDVLHQSVRVAQRGTQRVLRLINTLLDISRLEAGRMELILDKTTLADVVDDLLIEFVSLANQAGIILENKLSDDLPPLWADVDKLKRVIVNLVDNAIKFTPEGGKVTLSASQHGDGELRFQVRDTGPGIPSDYREKIFDRFVQVPGLNGRRRGSGLGLTFCSLAVEAHGGKIWVTNHSEGGSEFNFTLPLDGPPPDGEQVLRRSG